MSRLPALDYRHLVKKLRKLGFVYERQAKGSHELWLNLQTHQRTLVPHHAGKTLKRKTLKSIINDTGLSVEEFMKS